MKSVPVSICILPISKKRKIELIADTDGLLKINREALVAVNSLGEMTDRLPAWRFPGACRG